MTLLIAYQIQLKTIIPSSDIEKVRRLSPRTLLIYYSAALKINNCESFTTDEIQQQLKKIENEQISSKKRHCSR